MLPHPFTVLLVVAVIASSLAVFGGVGIIVSTLLLTVALYPYRFISICLLVLLLGFLVVWLTLPGIKEAMQVGPRAQGMNNLQQVTLALLNYEQHYGGLPPVCLSDKDGKPMHSWRVLILPLLGRRDLYEQYNFSEPWNGPNNRRLLAARPPEYGCPADADELTDRSASTSYVAVVGAEARWQKNAGVMIDDRSLSHSETVLLIGGGKSGIPWTEPRDFSLDDVNLAIDADLPVMGPHTSLNGYFFRDTPSGVNVGFADGHQRFLSTANLTADRLKRLLAIGGCIEDNIVEAPCSSEPKIHWPHCTLAAIWAISVVLLLYRAVRNRRVRTKLGPDVKNSAEQIAGG
jgi:prepilin-type processing-associated H-X9-DG protein